MKRLASILAALCLLLGLAACAGGDSVAFKNKLGTVIHSVYISPVEDEDWTDPLNYARLRVGSTIQIDFDRFRGTGTLYDFGAVDENGLNYDVYDIPLAAGDSLTLSGDRNGATLTVVSKDGAEKTYEAYIYENEA